MINVIVRVSLRQALLSQLYTKDEWATVEDVSKDNFAFFPAMAIRLI